MNFRQMVMMAIAHEGISQKALADRMNTTQQNLSSKLRSEKYSIDELRKVCYALNAKLTIRIEFDDGTRIE